MKTSKAVLFGIGRRILPLLVLVAVGAMTVAWQSQVAQGICDPATGLSCATPAQSSRHKNATRTPVPTPVPSSTATATSTTTPTLTATQTASPTSTVAGTSTAAPGAAAAPLVPPTNVACAQCGLPWPLLGGGAVLLLALGGLLFYLLFRRPLKLGPAKSNVFPDGRQNNTVTVPDGGLESATLTIHDGSLGGATITFQDPGGFENTIGGKDINDLSNSGMS